MFFDDKPDRYALMNYQIRLDLALIKFFNLVRTLLVGKLMQSLAFKYFTGNPTDISYACRPK